MSVTARYEALRKDRPHLRLDALVDGLVFEQVHGEPLQPQAGCVALFDGTDDAALASAGPWLVDAGARPDLCARLLDREAAAPHLSWLISGLPFEGLVQLLRLQLDMRLPDGRIGLLRFYDPRVLRGLADTLTAGQRDAFFGQIQEWHFMHDGRAHWIGRDDA